MRAGVDLNVFFSRCSKFYLRAHRNFHFYLWNALNHERPEELRSLARCCRDSQKEKVGALTD